MARAFWLFVAVLMVVGVFMGVCIKTLNQPVAETLIGTAVLAAMAAMLFVLASRRKVAIKDGIESLMAWYQRRYLSGVLLMFTLELGTAAWMVQKGATLFGIVFLLLIVAAVYAIITVVLFLRFAQGFPEVAQLYSEKEAFYRCH